VLTPLVIGKDHHARRWEGCQDGAVLAARKGSEERNSSTA